MHSVYISIMGCFLKNHGHCIVILLVHWRFHKHHSSIPAYCAQPKVCVVHQEIDLGYFNADLGQRVKNTAWVNIMYSDQSFFVSNCKIFFFWIDSSTCHFLLLTRSQKKCSDLFLGGYGPHSHEEVAVDSENLILAFYCQHRHDLRVLWVWDAPIHWELVVDVSVIYVCNGWCDVGLRCHKLFVQLLFPYFDLVQQVDNLNSRDY